MERDEETDMGNPVVHFEIGCRDQETTGQFYSQLFGWRLRAEGPAAHIDTGAEGGIPGHFTSLGHEPHQYTIFYVAVDDIPATLRHVEQLGGKRILGPIEIPTGSFAWFSDPGGNTVGLWKGSASSGG
jgi:predicted enzyme related to lactoylglutathione lyase